jgi:hypothetical protein
MLKTTKEITIFFGNVLSIHWLFVCWGCIFAAGSCSTGDALVARRGFSADWRLAGVSFH